MTNQGSLPTAGYAIEKIYTNKLLLNVRHAVEGENGNVFFKWDWKLIGPGRFEVTLGVKVEPSPTRMEEVEALFQGRFRCSSETPSVPLIDFAEGHAPGILMPYVRQALAAMTGMGFFGAFHVEPMNMRAVVADLGVTATGRQQLAEVGGATALLPPPAPPVKRLRRKSATKKHST